MSTDSVPVLSGLDDPILRQSSEDPCTTINPRSSSDQISHSLLELSPVHPVSMLEMPRQFEVPRQFEGPNFS